MSTHVCKTKKIKATTRYGKHTNRDSNISNSINYAKDRSNEIQVENILNDPIMSISDEAQQKMIDYTTNQNKCYDKESNTLLISGHNCSPNTAIKEFIEVERNYHAIKKESCRNGAIPNEAFHIMLSFKGKNVSPQKVHEIGKEFASRIAGPSFKALISTHTNTENYHDHIVLSAYAIDGPYKYKDEWNLAKKFMRISDELALENGLEIIVNMSPDLELESDDIKLKQLLENTTPIYHNIRDYKMAAKGITYKTMLMNDILLTAKNCDSFEKFEEIMIKKGYELQKNRKSITYCKKNYGMLRDNRLGYQFTEYYLRKYFKSKAISSNIDNYKKVKINKKNLYVPKYENDLIGKYRYSLLERLVMFFIKILQEIIHSSENLYNNSDSTYKNTKNLIQNNIKSLNKALNIIKKYNICDIYDKNAKFSQVLKEYVKYNNFLKEHSYTQAKFNKIIEAKTTIDTLKDFILSHNLTDDDLKLVKYGTLEILNNLAKTDPMNAKTKSRLYKALHNANFRLSLPFSAITEHQAKDIVYFLAKVKKMPKNTLKIDILSKKPDILLTKAEYFKKLKNGTLNTYKKTDFTTNLKPMDFSKYSNSEKELILRYKKARSLLLSYGLSTDEEYTNFYENRIKNVLHNIDNLKVKLLDLKEQIKDYNYLADCIENNFQSFKEPLKLIDDYDIIDTNIKNFIAENETRLDKLISLKSILENLDLSILDDETVSMAPMDIITAIEIINNLNNINISTDNIINLDKSTMKNIIESFIASNNVDDEIIELKNKELQEYNIRANDKNIQKSQNNKDSIDNQL